MTAEQKIRAAAVHLFAERGFAATGIRDLANEAGVATSVLYHYVSSKDELLLDIMMDGIHRLLDVTRIAIGDEERPEERLRVLVEVLVAVQALVPEDAKVLDHELHQLPEHARERVVAVRDEYEAIWSQTLASGKAKGVFMARDLGLLRLALIQMCNGVAYWFSPDGANSLEQVAQEFSQIALASASSSPAIPTRRRGIAAETKKIVALVRGFLNSDTALAARSSASEDQRAPAEAVST